MTETPELPLAATPTNDSKPKPKWKSSVPSAPTRITAYELIDSFKHRRQPVGDPGPLNSWVSFIWAKTFTGIAYKLPSEYKTPRKQSELETSPLPSGLTLQQ